MIQSAWRADQFLPFHAIFASLTGTIVHGCGMHKHDFLQLAKAFSPVHADVNQV